MDNLVERLTTLATDKRYDIQPSARAAMSEAATLITSLREALETAQAEIVQTREVCSLVRRQDYFDVPTPVLVEAQIEIAKWTAYDDLIRVAEFQRPAIDGALKRYRARTALNPSRKETI